MDGTVTSSTELFNLQTETWSNGDPLPVAAEAPMMVKDRDNGDLVVIAGFRMFKCAMNNKWRRCCCCCSLFFDHLLLLLLLLSTATVVATTQQHSSRCCWSRRKGFASRGEFVAASPQVNATFLYYPTNTQRVQILMRCINEM